MLAQSDQRFFLPERASTYAADVDWLFFFIFAIAAFFFLLIVTLMVVFVIRYRQREGHPGGKAPNHSTALELTWTIIPVVLVVIIFSFGFKGFMNMTTSPVNAYEIMVTARKWNWTFEYPNGFTDTNLHVPVDRPVRLVLTSEDVIHSLYIPAFRIKKDCVPKRFNTLWFQATQINAEAGFDLFCAEYCGTQHSDMIAKVYVHEPNDFKAWMENAANWEGRIAPKTRGADLYKSRGCAQCHSIDGTRIIGPSFKSAWTEIAHGETTFRDGKRLSDYLGPNYSPEDYVRESIFEPRAKTVAGYDDVMATYKGSLKENDVMAIIAYLKSLSGVEDTAPASAPATQAENDGGGNTDGK